MKRALLAGAALAGAALTAALAFGQGQDSGSPDKLEIEVHYTDVNGLACPCGGIAQGFLMPGAAGYGLARGVNSLKLLGDLSKFVADPDSMPTSTGDLARYAARGIPFDLSSLPFATRYSGTLHATLKWSDARSRWEVESGSLQYSASDTTHFSGSNPNGGGGTITDQLKGSGTYTLKPGSDEVVITQKDRDDPRLDQALQTSQRTCRSPDATYRLKIQLNHKMTVQGDTKWIGTVKGGGEIFRIDEKQSGDNRTLSGHGLDQPIPTQTQKMEIAQPWHYEQKLTLQGGVGRFGDSWPDEAGGKASLRGTVNVKGEVEARPRLSKSRPTRVEDLVTLDASGSLPKGKITKWKWTFHDVEMPDQPVGNSYDVPFDKTAGEAAVKGQTLEKEKASARFLAPLCATLQVTADSGKTDTRSIRFDVAPRQGGQWTMVPVTTTDPLYGDSWNHLSNGGHNHFGRNDCVIEHDFRDEGGGSGHWVHHGDSGSDYHIKTIQDDDPQAPFHGWEYVDSIDDSLVVKRQRVLNPDFQSGTPFSNVNAKNGHAKDEALLQQSVATHEQIHSDLAAEALGASGGANDPRFHLEYLGEPAGGRLGIRAEGKINACDCQLKNASLDAAVQARMARIYGSQTVTLSARNSNDDWVPTVFTLAGMTDESQGCK